MDKFDNQSSTTKAGGGLISCACLAAMITLLVYLGIYAFNNPNTQAFYDATTDSLVIAQNAEGTLVPIHDQFVLWFTWMFINACVSIGFMMCVGPILACCMMRCEILIRCVGGLYSCGICCSSLACFITGAVFRFSTAGNYASQEPDTEGLALLELPLLQTSSGKFMFIYFIIMFSLIGLCVCLTIFGILCKAFSS